MDSQSAINTYRNQSIENAPPIKILRMLYQGALRFLERARREDPSDPNSKFTHWVRKTEDIVCELRITLEPEHAPALCEDLERLYLFVEDRLNDAVDDSSVEPLAECTSVLEKLLEAWVDVESQGVSLGNTAA